MRLPERCEAEAEGQLLPAGFGGPRPARSRAARGARPVRAARTEPFPRGSSPQEVEGQGDAQGPRAQGVAEGGAEAGAEDAE